MIHCYNYLYNFIAFQEAKGKMCLEFIILKFLLLSYLVLFFPVDLTYHLGHKCNFLSESYTALLPRLLYLWAELLLSSI